MSLTLITEPNDLFQPLHLCHRDKAICLSLQSTWRWRGGKHSEASCNITASQRSLARGAGPFLHLLSLLHLLAQRGCFLGKLDLCCSGCRRPGKRNYAWGVRGGGKGQVGNQCLLFSHFGSFIIIVVVNDCIPKVYQKIEVRRKQRGEARRRKQVEVESKKKESYGCSLRKGAQG